jgi:hypothetical protein
MSNVTSINKYRKPVVTPEPENATVWEHHCGSQSWKILVSGELRCRMCDELAGTVSVDFTVETD